MTLRFVKPNPIVACGNPKPSNKLEEEFVEQDVQCVECAQSVPAEWPSKTEMNVYYFTFGCDQKHEGEVQPIHANNMMVARNKMFELFGEAWAFSYSEEEWNKWKKQVADEHLPFPIERERKPVYVYSEESEG